MPRRPPAGKQQQQADGKTNDGQREQLGSPAGAAPESTEGAKGRRVSRSTTPSTCQEETDDQDPGTSEAKQHRETARRCGRR